MDSFSEADPRGSDGEGILEYHGKFYYMAKIARHALVVNFLTWLSSEENRIF